MKELNELVEMAKNATPGPWKAATDWERAAVYSTSKDAYPENKRVVCSGNQNNHKRFNAEPWSGSDWNDAAFIAAANPATILAIAEAFRALEQRLNEDTMRMDWLVSKTVNVRQPLPYGSHNIFWAQQTSDDCDENYTTDLREQIDTILRNIEERELDAKRIAFITSLADDTAPQQFHSLAGSAENGKKGHLKYRFDQHWFAVDGCRETATHYVARLLENGVVTHYAKSLYDFRPENQEA